MLVHDSITDLRMRYAVHQAEKAVGQSLRDAEAALDRHQLQAQQQRDAADQRVRANQSAMALAQRLQVEREARKSVAWPVRLLKSMMCPWASTK